MHSLEMHVYIITMLLIITTLLMKGDSVASLKDRNDIMSSWLPRKLQLKR